MAFLTADSLVVWSDFSTVETMAVGSVFLKVVMMVVSKAEKMVSRRAAR